MRGFLQVQVAFIVFMCVCSEPDLVVQTEQGYARGVVLKSSRSNHTFYAFMGIPYAKPPIHDLRFKAPQAPESWTGVRNATVEGSVCPQVNEFTRNAEGEEDCLFLNIYTRKLPSEENTTLTPVMVSIHGGSFSLGSGNRETQGPDFLVDHGVIVVTLNYRLGLLGFLSLQNTIVPGNNGLKDQVMALRWVQQNIAQFGGDPSNITIFGVSAGGACVHFHMLSPMSRGLFHRAISQSGCALSPWAFHSAEGNYGKALDVGHLLNINTSSPEAMYQELRYLSLEQLWPAIRLINSFVPTVDTTAEEGNVFLPDKPRNLINAGLISNVPYITGITSSEGILLAPVLRRNTEIFMSHIETLSFVYQDINLNSSLLNEATIKLKEFYYGNSANSNASLQQFINLITDIMFTNGIYCAATKQAENSTAAVYMYEFSFSGNMSIFKILHGGEDLQGASHADDLIHIYHTSFHNRTFIPESAEYILSQRMVKMWTNFAKTGNPTPEADPLLQNVTWTPVNSTTFSYLRIDHDLTLQHVFRNGSVRFWEDLFQRYTSHSLCS